MLLKDCKPLDIVRVKLDVPVTVLVTNRGHVRLDTGEFLDHLDIRYGLPYPMERTAVKDDTVQISVRKHGMWTSPCVDEIEELEAAWDLARDIGGEG